MKLISDIATARQYIRDGLVIAYPTEAVFGIGCDVFNDDAVQRLLKIKNRPVEKGMICLISVWEQLNKLVADLDSIDLTKVKGSWPGHTTWLFPKSKKVSSFISGGHASVAIRMSAHKIANDLAIDGPIVSTSANITGLMPARTVDEVLETFTDCIDGVVIGSLGASLNPSSIYDVLTGERLR